MKKIDAAAALDVAFANLRKEGVLAYANLKCCQTCAWAFLDPKLKGKPKNATAVFYHGQDADGLEEENGTYLGFCGDGLKIVGALMKAGLAVTWDGTNDTRIFASGNLPRGS